MEISYKPTGVCCSNIIFEIENDIVTNVRFIGGCSGNQQGVGALAKGMHVKEVVDRLEGIRCGAKPTSCPDQFARALKAQL